ncbi:MAG: sensor histidine kinase [Stackebrandtia sp.]
MRRDRQSADRGRAETAGVDDRPAADDSVPGARLDPNTPDPSTADAQPDPPTADTQPEPSTADAQPELLAAGIRSEPVAEDARLEWVSDGLLALLPMLALLLVLLNGGADEHAVPLLLGPALAQSVLLLWCRRFPLTVLIAVMSLEALLAVLESNTIAGVLAATFGLGLWGKRRQQYIGIALVLVTVLLGGPVLSTADGVSIAGFTVLHLAAIAVFAGFWLVGRLGARQRRTAAEWRARSRHLEAERELVERQAAERERSLLGRELHDILNHSVTTMVLDAAAAAETGADAELTLHRIADTGRASLAELRRLLSVLREPPTEHDPLAVPPGLDRIDELAARSRARLERRGRVRPVDASIELAAYRIVQEALTNVTKHAGDVETLVSLSFSPESLTVRVDNAAPNGPGRSPEGGGIGLIGMRERVQLLDGSLDHGPRAGGGFEVCAVLPIRSRS